MMKLSLFGYGKTNRAIAERFAPCDIYDDSFEESGVDSLGNRLLPPRLFDPESSDVEVTTPGIPPHHPLIQGARHLQSEYDFFADSIPYSIWISGTNGKTTTTEMIQHLLAPKGSECGGNIGTPLAKLNPKAPIWVLETSSFTLHYTQKAKPNLYLLLPISEDHISWHGSYEAYIKAKLKPLGALKEKEVAIIPKRFLGTPTRGTLIGYEDTAELIDYFGMEREKIGFLEPFLMDAVMALAVYKILFDEIPYERLNEFKIGAHKIEEFTDGLGRLWVDDSKATNVDAANEAVKRYEGRFVHLILGGDDKGADLTPLFELLEGRSLQIYAIGSNALKIERLAKERGIACKVCERLEKAVEAIRQNLKANEVALLSPAAASLDQFSSYKERGDSFKRYALL